MRNIDICILRSDSFKVDPNARFFVSGSYEQARRASIRQVALDLGLKIVKNTSSELNVLKEIGLIGKRAPCAGLLSFSDALSLLIAFGYPHVAETLLLLLQTIPYCSMLSNPLDSFVTTSFDSIMRTMNVILPLTTPSLRQIERSRPVPILTDHMIRYYNEHFSFNNHYNTPFNMNLHLSNTVPIYFDLFAPPPEHHDRHNFGHDAAGPTSATPQTTKHPPTVTCSVMSAVGLWIDLVLRQLDEYHQRLLISKHKHAAKMQETQMGEDGVAESPLPVITTAMLTAEEKSDAHAVLDNSDLLPPFQPNSAVRQQFYRILLSSCHEIPQDTLSYNYVLQTHIQTLFRTTYAGDSSVASSGGLFQPTIAPSTSQAGVHSQRPSSPPRTSVGGSNIKEQSDGDMEIVDVDTLSPPPSSSSSTSSLACASTCPPSQVFPSAASIPVSIVPPPSEAFPVIITPCFNHHVRRVVPHVTHPVEQLDDLNVLEKASLHHTSEVTAVQSTTPSDQSMQDQPLIKQEEHDASHRASGPAPDIGRRSTLLTDETNNESVPIDASSEADTLSSFSAMATTGVVKKPDTAVPTHPSNHPHSFAQQHDIFAENDPNSCLLTIPFLTLFQHLGHDAYLHNYDEIKFTLEDKILKKIGLSMVNPDVVSVTNVTTTTPTIADPTSITSDRSRTSLENDGDSDQHGTQQSDVSPHDIPTDSDHHHTDGADDEDDDDDEDDHDDEHDSDHHHHPLQGHSSYDPSSSHLASYYPSDFTSHLAGAQAFDSGFMDDSVHPSARLRPKKRNGRFKKVRKSILLKTPAMRRKEKQKKERLERIHQHEQYELQQQLSHLQNQVVNKIGAVTIQQQISDVYEQSPSTHDLYSDSHLHEENSHSEHGGSYPQDDDRSHPMAGTRRNSSAHHHQHNHRSDGEYSLSLDPHNDSFSHHQHHKLHNCALCDLPVNYLMYNSTMRLHRYCSVEEIQHCIRRFNLHFVRRFRLLVHSHFRKYRALLSPEINTYRALLPYTVSCFDDSDDNSQSSPIKQESTTSLQHGADIKTEQGGVASSSSSSSSPSGTSSAPGIKFDPSLAQLHADRLSVKADMASVLHVKRDPDGHKPRRSKTLDDITHSTQQKMYDSMSHDELEANYREYLDDIQQVLDDILINTIKVESRHIAALQALVGELKERYTLQQQQEQEQQHQVSLQTTGSDDSTTTGEGQTRAIPSQPTMVLSQGVSQNSLETGQGDELSSALGSRASGSSQSDVTSNAPSPIPNVYDVSPLHTLELCFIKPIALHISSFCHVLSATAENRQQQQHGHSHPTTVGGSSSSSGSHDLTSLSSISGAEHDLEPKEMHHTGHSQPHHELGPASRRQSHVSSSESGFSKDAGDRALQTSGLAPSGLIVHALDTLFDTSASYTLSTRKAQTVVRIFDQDYSASPPFLRLSNISRRRKTTEEISTLTQRIRSAMDLEYHQQHLAELETRLHTTPNDRALGIQVEDKLQFIDTLIKAIGGEPRPRKSDTTGGVSTKNNSKTAASVEDKVGVTDIPSSDADTGGQQASPMHENDTNESEHNHNDDEEEDLEDDPFDYVRYISYFDVLPIPKVPVAGFTPQSFSAKHSLTAPQHSSARSSDGSSRANQPRRTTARHQAAAAAAAAAMTEHYVDETPAQNRASREQRYEQRRQLRKQRDLESETDHDQFDDHPAKGRSHNRFEVQSVSSSNDDSQYRGRSRTPRQGGQKDQSGYSADHGGDGDIYQHTVKQPRYAHQVSATGGYNHHPHGMLPHHGQDQMRVMIGGDPQHQQHHLQQPHHHHQQQQQQQQLLSSHMHHTTAVPPSDPNYHPTALHPGQFQPGRPPMGGLMPGAQQQHQYHAPQHLPYASAHNPHSNAMGLSSTANPQFYRPQQSLPQQQQLGANQQLYPASHVMSHQTQPGFVLNKPSTFIHPQQAQPSTSTTGGIHKPMIMGNLGIGSNSNLFQQPGMISHLNMGSSGAPNLQQQHPPAAPFPSLTAMQPSSHYPNVPSLHQNQFLRK